MHLPRNVRQIFMAAEKPPNMATAQRFMPTPTPETQHFWDGARRRELRLQRCQDCAKAYFPPRPFCPACGSRDVSAFVASGRATLYSYAIQYRPAPGFTPPYSIAVVTLEEGPHMLTNIVGCPQTPEVLELDMPLLVDYQVLDERITLPVFRPTRASA